MSFTKSHWDRRALLGGAAGSGAAVLAWKPWARKDQEFHGQLLGPSRAVHGLLTQKPDPKKPALKKALAIIGGGVSGLSAARALKNKGFHDFVLLEGEESCGGNSRSGSYQNSAFPWGAHYLPLPHPRMKELIAFLREIDVIEGFDAESSLPIYREEYLCAEPHERLKIAGTWQEGTVPVVGIKPREADDLKAFFALIEVLKNKRGADGRPAFTLPLDESSEDPEFRALDKMSFAAFLKERRWDSPALSWYLEYACRDDFGMRLPEVSAWAGLHYFAARDGQAANAPSSSVLTWPEGNAFLVKHLLASIEAHVRSRQWVTRIERQSNRSWLVSAWNERDSAWESWNVDALILAIPRKVAAYLLADPMAPAYQKSLHHSPWLTAKIALHQRPLDARQPLSWDNVLYQGEGLGYIYSGQQELSAHVRNHVLTYYRPIDHAAPAEARRQLIGKGWKDFLPYVLPDLEAMHPGIRANIKELDIWLWGHGMIGPGIGFLWGDLRKAMKREEAGLVYAHCDGSGMSLFEEAFYQGLLAASRVTAFL